MTSAHHEVSAATEHFSWDAAVSAAGVFRIQDITGDENISIRTRKTNALWRNSLDLALHKIESLNSPLNNPVPLDQQRHLLDASQHCGLVSTRGEQTHQVSERHHFDCREHR